ncbi:MAG: Rieske 2Fe-2S domain-containing protein [Candidatus Omnitrophica bacterium]|nr:Rieske 2Fe-2S domain-containing protein [Candidatus Omnitrophota bacterium]
MTEESKSTNPASFDRPMSRRDFIDWIIKGGLLTTLAGMLFPALAYLWPVTRRGPAHDMVEVGREDEIHVGGSKKVVLGGTALLVIRTATEFKAFSAVCTHLGCIVFWDSAKQLIACPCHAGFFDLSGRVVSGPPPRPLASHPVNVVDGKIFVKP